MIKEDHYGIANTILLGSLKEMLASRELVYSQIISSRSHLTELGEKYVLDLIGSLLPLLIEAHGATAKDAAELLMLQKLGK